MLEEKRINIGRERERERERERLSDLKFLDDAATTTESNKDTKYQLHTVDEESLKVILKILREQTQIHDKY